MKTIIYNKLVRDKIPAIIEQSGKTCICERLPEAEYMKMLNEKLKEEMDEYMESGSIEELADLAEVIQAILDFNNMSVDEFLKIKQDKADKRGGFKDKILLKEVVEG